MFNFTNDVKQALIELLEKEMEALEECGDESTTELFNSYEEALAELVK